MGNMINQETLEDGRVLLHLKHRFAENKTQQNLVAVLSCLRDSSVYVPLEETLSDEEMELLQNMKPGDKISMELIERCKPQIMQKDGKFYFPMFSNMDQVPEEWKERSIFYLPVLKCIALAKTFEKVTGMVLDVFTEPMVLDYNLVDLIPQIKSKSIQ